MGRLHQLLFGCLFSLSFTACDKSGPDTPPADEVSAENTSAPQEAAVGLSEEELALTNDEPYQEFQQSTFKTLTWTELLPEEDLKALLNPPEYVNDIVDGSDQDRIGGQLKNTQSEAPSDPYQQALTSTRVVPELDGKAIKLPGFIVPLEFDDDLNITQFFLVPYFGACIHTPPPPPNQIVFVDYPQGLHVEALYDPFWIYGDLKTSYMENAMAAAAYSMKMKFFEPYSED